MPRAGEAVELAGRTDDLDLHAHALMDRAEVMRLTGRDADAAPVVEHALQMFERKSNIVMARRRAPCWPSWTAPAPPELGRARP